MAKAVVDTLLQGYQVDSKEGSIAFCGVNLVEAPDGSGGTTRIVVDTGHFGRGLVLRQALADRGLSGSDIDVLLLTHAHWDHVQGIQYFDNARIVTHPTELNYISDPHGLDHATPAWTKAMLDQYDIRSVTEGDDLAPGVSVVEAPGHSPGTIALSVETDDGVAMITGDSIQNAMVAQQRRNALVFWSEEQANRSVRKLVDLADVIYPGHDQAFRISGDNQVEYVAEFSFGLRQVLPDTPGLSFDFDPELKPRVFEPPKDWVDAHRQHG